MQAVLNMHRSCNGGPSSGQVGPEVSVSRLASLKPEWGLLVKWRREEERKRGCWEPQSRQNPRLLEIDKSVRHQVGRMEAQWNWAQRIMEKRIHHLEKFCYEE
jgi:hypothetical protein